MDSLAIPRIASALVTILGGEGCRDEFVATLAVDTYASVSAPIGECVRVDVDSLGSLPESFGSLLRLLRSLEPLFPGARHFIGVLEDSQQGRIIFLPKPCEADNTNGVTGGGLSHGSPD